MIFDQLNDLLFTKERKCMDNVDHESDYSPYMINRWISMYSPELAHVINNTVNWTYQVFETKSEHYNFLHTVIPRVNRKRINYIKKTKRDKESKPEHDVSMLAKSMELSQREIQTMLDML